MTPEEKVGAFASYLEIEFQQKTNVCKYLLAEIERECEILEIFERNQSENDKEVVVKFILKPLYKHEESIECIKEWKAEYLAKFNKITVKCENEEYLDSVIDVLNRYIIELDVTIEELEKVLKDKKERVLKYLGIRNDNEDTV